MSSRYRVFCDGELFSDTYIPDPDWHAQEPNLKMGDNSAGSFEFALTPSNAGYDMIERMASTIVIGKDDDVFWSGRVISQTEDFFKRRKYVCEGALAYLNDSHVGIDKSSLSLDDLVVKVITDHNNKMTTNQTIMNRPSAFRALKILKSNVDIMELLADESNLEDNSEYEFNNETTLDWISNNVVGALGCHVYIKYTTSVSDYLKTKDPKPYIVFLSDYLTNSDQQINFGVNLLDFTKNWDLSNLVTVIIPRGEQLAVKTDEVVDTVTPGPKTDDVPDDGLTHYLTVKYAVTNKTQTGTSSSGKPIYSYTYYGDQDDPDGNKNDIYVYNTNAYRKYGRIEKIVDFSDVTDAKYLLKLAKIYVKSMQFDGMQIEMSAIDLHNVDSTVTRFNLLEMVRCISLPHGMDTRFPIVEMELDLENPANDKYTLGESNVTSLSGVSRSNNKELMAHFSGYPAPSRMLDVARYEVTNILNNRQVRGYVNIVQVSDTSQAVVISDTQDWHQATNLWKWDMNGLGFSDRTVEEAGYSSAQAIARGYNGYDMDGEDRWFKTAITADGHIVADFVSTGILSDGAGTAGQNWWNLTNGEFHLSGLAKVGDGNTTINDINNIANEANNAVVGGVNLLDGTFSYDRWVRSPNNQWSISDGVITCNAQSNASTNVYIISAGYEAAKPSKNGKIKKPEYKPKTYASLSGRKYVLSFEIASADNWGSKSTNNQIVVQIILTGKNNTILTASPGYSFDATTKWGKKVLKFNLTNSEISAKYSNTIADNVRNSSYVRIKITNRSKHKIQIKSIKLEEGTKATAWSPSPRDSTDGIVSSEYDLYTTIKDEYEAAISNSDKGFSQAQKDILSAAVSRAAILNKLTDGGKKQGIYVSRGKLYLNGEFMKTGSLSADSITVGVITNNNVYKKKGLATKKKAFYIDFKTGMCNLKGALFENIVASGAFDCGTNAITKIQNGALKFYWQTKAISVFSTISGIGMNTDGGCFVDARRNSSPQAGATGAERKLHSGIFMSTKGPMFLRSTGIYICNKSGLGTSGKGIKYYQGATGKIEIPMVSRISNNWDQADNAILTLHFVNGLLVDLVYNG